MFLSKLKNFSAYNYLLFKAQIMVPSEDMWHMSRVQKCVLKLVNFLVQNLQKPYMIDLVTHSNLICDALWSICHIGGLWQPL